MRNQSPSLDALDRSVIEYVVTCEHNGVRFFIADSPGNPATDILDRARRFRDFTDGELFAQVERRVDAWHGRAQ